MISYVFWLDRHERNVKHDADLFYKVISARYDGHQSTIITTNIDWEQWGDYLGGNDVATAAILDRLIHHGHSISIEGPSWRADQHKRLNASSEDES
ncbi:MAG: ATP-binding protein [Bradymonadaceae bacterium]